MSDDSFLKFDKPVEVIQENGKFYTKQEIDIDDLIAKQESIKASLLEQVSRCDATIQELQNKKVGL